MAEPRRYARQVCAGLLAAATAACWPGAPTARAEVVKRVIRVPAGGTNLLRDDAWRPWEKGFRREEGVFVCDNGADAKARRGASQSVRLNQTQPRPIVATVWSKAEGVGGTPDSNYSLYLDLVYADGRPLWGQVHTFRTGTGDWQAGRVMVVPAKPVRHLSFHMLLRGHSGRARFREPRLFELTPPKGAALFDGVAVELARTGYEGFQVRDAAAGGDFVSFDADGKALGLTLQAEWTGTSPRKARVRLTDTTGRDRAVTLVYTAGQPAKGAVWLADPRRSEPVQPRREYAATYRTRAGTGRMSRWPLAAVAAGKRGKAIALDMARPAVYRVGYNAAAEELFIAYDLALTKERPTAETGLALLDFDAAWGFRGAWAAFQKAFAPMFVRRIDRQGLWMPFAKISAVRGWEDFGFRIKEGTSETAWDDKHGILTFRYTEPMTWWMRMPKAMPRTYAAALTHAKALAAGGNRQARALLTSGMHDSTDRLRCLLRDTPWCNGAVWSMNSAPGIRGEVTDFKNKWNADLRERLHGAKRKADQDGEYVDSSEGYVTAELNFRRDHFGAMATPLTFDRDSHRPAIFRGLVAFEYVRALENQMRAAKKLTMANGAPTRLPWLAPMLDMLGTETNWHRGGTWRPMSDAEMLYRRALCGPKPYCFLMNTAFEQFSHALVEKYMKRCLAYGMFPSFFSHNASQGHYFTRPELYDRDRPLFKKYVPLCRRVAEAGWEPITLARSDNATVYLERFGSRYLTIFNDSPKRQHATITLAGLKAGRDVRDLVTGKTVALHQGRAPIDLAPEDVAVLDLRSGG